MPSGSRAAALVAGAGLVAAWLASAADRQPSPTATASEPHSAALVRAEQLAQEIEAQATRLRSRLAVAPQPGPSERNPFTFDTRPSRSTRERISAGSLDLAAAPSDDTGADAVGLPEPEPLTLSGIAEDGGEAAGKAAPVVRTAVLSGFGDVFLAKAGDTIASRFEVVLVGADAVELKDLTTGRTIRLGLR